MWVLIEILSRLKANVEREILKEYLAVYDTEKKDWRSFRWDSLIGS